MILITKRSFFFLAFIFIVRAAFSQQVGIGQWRDELPYNQVISVTEGDGKIYSATPYAVFSVDKADNSVQRLTKINGLSDIGISTICYSKSHQTLVIAYSNANIDLLKNNTIINISDIKRKSILGNKTINRVSFIGDYAYLSCGFGIVVLDVDKEEIHDTYYIGKNGDQINVLGLVKNDEDTLFAATEKGIYVASFLSPNLVNYAVWHKDPRMDTNFRYNAIAFFSGQVIVSKDNSTSTSDTLFRYSGRQWSKWSPHVDQPVQNIESTYDYLCIAYNYFVESYDPQFNLKYGVYQYYPGTTFPLDAIVDKDQLMWVGDTYSGLISIIMSSNSYNHFNLSGPISAQAFWMTTNGDDLYIVPGGRDNSFVPLFYGAQIYHFDIENWSNIYGGNNQPLFSINDYVTVAVDPLDPKRIYAGSWGKGVTEFYNGVFVNRYTQGNSKLYHHSATTDTGDVRVGGIAFDKAGNLWAVCTHTNNCLSRKSGSNWTGYNITINNESDLGQLLIDRNDQKWILMRYENMNPNSILVFSDNDTPDDPSDDKMRKLNSSAGYGSIPGNNVFAIAEDLDGEIWVGTEKGIGVFYAPENIFAQGGDEAQQILVQQGTYTQYLLENETVTAIAVDGGNNKWIGTDRGGVFQFSPDGTKELNHFTEDNSPLFSNRITSLAINKTGEVFIGTDKGVLSYRGTATTPGSTNENVYAFPNPVNESYSGWIAIKGLVANATVKITDVNGTLVYSTIAEGGQAIWDGKNFDGKKARTGVYLVFASTATGTEKVVTKILIIH